MTALHMKSQHNPGLGPSSSNSNRDPDCTRCRDCFEDMQLSRLKPLAEQIIKGIERRLSYVTFLPVENGEGLQILRYEVRGGAAAGWAWQQLQPSEGASHGCGAVSSLASF